MRESFVHVAVVEMDPAADLRAIGGAVTLELCGSWEHEPPCPLAPHLTEAARRDAEVDVRILFAAEPDRAAEVRSRIDRALARGSIVGPDGVSTEWQVRSSAASQPQPAEVEQTRRW